MGKKAITLYVEDTSLKLLVAQGKEIKKWANVSLSPGLVSDGVIADPTQLAQEIKQLLKAQNVKENKLITGLSGLHCLYRIIILPSLPKAVLPEAVNREAERLLPVALNEFYISWQIIHESTEEIKVFLAAYPRNATDALAETLHQAGIEPYLDLAPLALAKVSNRPTAIIADIRQGEADIVIMVDGVPELIRSLSIPTETESPQEKLYTVRDEIERTIKFYNSSNPEKPLEADTPVYISGELGEKPELSQSLLDKINYPILPLPSPLEGPEGLVVAPYMVNIGLALRKLSLGQRANLSIVDLNLKSGTYQRKPVSIAKIAVLPSLVVGVILLVYLISQVRSATADTSSIKTQLSNTSQQMLLIQKKELSQKQEIADLTKKVTELEATSNALTKVYNSFGSQQDTTNIDLKTAINNAPTAIKVTSVDQSDKAWTVKGWTPSESEVLAYVAKLDSGQRFSKITITTMKKDNKEGGMTFTLVLTK